MERIDEQEYTWDDEYDVPVRKKKKPSRTLKQRWRSLKLRFRRALRAFLAPTNVELFDGEITDAYTNQLSKDKRFQEILVKLDALCEEWQVLRVREISNMTRSVAPEFCIGEHDLVKQEMLKSGVPAPKPEQKPFDSRRPVVK